MLIFAKVDVNLTNHLKARKAGVAMATWTWALLYSREHEMDGRVPHEALELAWVDLRTARRHAAKLVEVGLWKETAEGYEIVNYAPMNDTRAVIKGRQKKEQDRYKNGQRVVEPVSNLGSEKLSVLDVFDEIPERNAYSTSTSSSTSLKATRLELVPPLPPSEPEPPSELTREQQRELNMNRYVEAYEKAVVDAKGGTFTFPVGPRCRSDLATVMNGHCKDKSGKKYRGEKTTEWISVHVFNFVRDVIDSGKSQYYSGFGPSGFAKYLNESFVKQEARAVP